MKELLQTIFTTSKERISNPIIGSFIISWIAFNWKSLVVFLFSSQTIENKIIYIDSNFSNINHLLFVPLLAVITYVLIIPYINLLFEYLLEYSRIKINSISISKQKLLIENKKELAIEEIKLEEAQAEFKDRKNQNKLIEDLHKSIQDKDEQLQIERERFNDLNKKIKDESTYLNKRFQEDRKDFDLKINSLLQENEMLRLNLNEFERKFKTSREILNHENLYIRENDKFYITENGQSIRVDSHSEKDEMKLKDKGAI